MRSVSVSTRFKKYYVKSDTRSMPGLPRSARRRHGDRLSLQLTTEARRRWLGFLVRKGPPRVAGPLDKGEGGGLKAHTSERSKFITKTKCAIQFYPRHLSYHTSCSAPPHHPSISHSCPIIALPTRLPYKMNYLFLLFYYFIFFIILCRSRTHVTYFYWYSTATSNGVWPTTSCLIQYPYYRRLYFACTDHQPPTTDSSRPTFLAPRRPAPSTSLPPTATITHHHHCCSMLPIICIARPTTPPTPFLISRLVISPTRMVSWSRTYGKRTQNTLVAV